jgi:hypothetical protein
LEEDKKTREPDISVKDVISRAASSPLYETVLRNTARELRKSRLSRAQREGLANAIETVLNICNKGD